SWLATTAKRSFLVRWMRRNVLSLSAVWALAGPAPAPMRAAAPRAPVSVYMFLRVISILVPLLVAWLFQLGDCQGLNQRTETVVLIQIPDDIDDLVLRRF